jgi:hypothetical protein
MDGSDRTAHSLTVTTGNNNLLINFQESYALGISRLQPLSIPWDAKRLEVLGESGGSRGQLE